MVRFSLTCLAVLLLWGCSAAPRQELQAARLAVARAEHAGARDLAADAFARADAALREGEALVRQREFARARAILPQAEQYARESVVAAADERARRERARAEAEAAAAAAAAAEAAAAVKVETPPEEPPPPPPPKVVKTAPEPAPAPLTSYPVRDDENLWTIAARKEVYGDPMLWPILYRANRDQIKDPRQVYPGQVLVIPRGLPPRDLEEAREKARLSDIFPINGAARN
jgi:nucleoid-associated protein YgaU